MVFITAWCDNIYQYYKHPYSPPRVFYMFKLQVVRTNLNYRVLGTSTTNIFLSKDHFLYAPRMDGMLDFIVWDQSTCQERVGRDYIQNEKVLPTVGLKPTTFRCVVRCYTDLATRDLMKETFIYTCTTCLVVLCMLKQSNRTCASFCYLYNINILQYVTQNST